MKEIIKKRAGPAITLKQWSTISEVIFLTASIGLFSEGKPTRMRRLCLKTSKAEGRGGLGITSSSEEVYELML